MTPNNIAPLNIIILPDLKVSQKALELSKKISQNYETYFTLDNQNFIPHITLYQTIFPKNNVSVLKDRIQKFAKTLKPFKITISTFSVSNETWASWNFLKTEELMKLELQILELANPLREDLIPENLKQLVTDAKGKQETENYGALLIKDRYTPHITLTRIKNPQDRKKVIDLIKEKSELSFLVDKLFLGNLGEHGTINQIVTEFPFGN